MDEDMTPRPVASALATMIGSLFRRNCEQKHYLTLGFCRCCGIYVKEIRGLPRKRELGGETLKQKYLVERTQRTGAARSQRGGCRPIAGEATGGNYDEVL